MISKEELEELYDLDTWDDESAVVCPPVKNPRAIVSVPFTVNELRQVSEGARGRGLRMTTFIREAALERASRYQSTTVVGAGASKVYPSTPSPSTSATSQSVKT
jgi:hypothetical protein